MSLSGSDRLDYNYAVNKGFDLIESGENPSFGLFVVCACNLALRVSDIRKISYQDIYRGFTVIIEKKTKKKRKIVFNSVIMSAVSLLPNSSKGYVFVSQKGTPYSSQHLNRLIKKYFDEPGKLYTTHSFRKTFARHYFDTTSDDKAMIKLSMLLNHSSVETTRIYLGITEEEQDMIYDAVGQTFNRKTENYGAKSSPSQRDVVLFENPGGMCRIQKV